MLTIKNIDKLIGKGFVTDVNNVVERKHWTVQNVKEFETAYQILVNRKLGIFDDEWVIIELSRIDKDGYATTSMSDRGSASIRATLDKKSIKTRDKMLNTLRSIMPC